MDSCESGPMSGDLEERLGELGRVRAPSGFVGRVLAACGLVDRVAQLSTPIGPFYAVWGPGGVRAVRRYPPPGAVPGELPAGIGFDLGELGDFQRAVLVKTLEIPPGEVRSYAWVARELGRPKAVRAVGNALARNPVPILIPCHRVVRSDGRVGDYGAGGPQAKRAILAAEGVDLAWLEGLARRGTRFVGSRSTRVFCFPTCRHARRIQPRHQVSFVHEQEALAAGYRPCRHCRPTPAAA